MELSGSISYGSRTPVVFVTSLGWLSASSSGTSVSAMPVRGNRNVNGDGNHDAIRASVANGFERAFELESVLL